MKTRVVEGNPFLQKTLEVRRKDLGVLGLKRRDTLGDFLSFGAPRKRPTHRCSGEFERELLGHLTRVDKIERRVLICRQEPEDIYVARTLGEVISPPSPALISSASSLSLGVAIRALLLLLLSPATPRFLKVLRRDEARLLIDHVEFERDGTLVFAHHFHLGATNMREPVRELFEVRERCGKAQNPHRSRQVNEHFFPNGAAIRVVHEVNFVHDHRA